MRTATLVRQLDRGRDDIDARLYRLSEPMSEHNWSEDRTIRSRYVVVSGSKLPELQQPETYIFLADEAGEILSWTECEGSFQGAVDHTQALENAGFQIIEGTTMPKSRCYTFVVSAQAAERQFTGFVDMLRYDGACVIEASTSMIVLQADNPPTRGRWASFGLHILSQQEGDYPDIRTLKTQAADKLPL